MPKFAMLGALAALSLCLVTAARVGAADDKPAAAAPAATPAPAAAANGQYFELRIYTAAAGKMEALQKRFRDHTLRLFEKHGIKSVGYWSAVDEKHVGRFYFILAYPNKESHDARWDAFAKDPEWVKAKDESEKDGKLVDNVEQVFLNPADFSPIK